jgi:DNA N-6-adenine-methyltransferase (Dam)
MGTIVNVNNKLTYSDEWYTPASIYGNLGKFDLDPACGPLCKNYIAEHKFTEGGLQKPWFGRVFLNPPYSQIGPWVDKMVAHNNGILFVFARTEVAWFSWALRACGGVFLLFGRVQFTRPIPKLGKGGRVTKGCPLGSCLFPFDKDKVAAPNKKAILESGIKGHWLELREKNRRGER